MKCRNWIERLPSLLDEDPRSPGRRQLEAHIETCQGCRSQWRLMNRIKAEAGRLDGLEPGDGVWQGIQGELAGQAAEAPKKPIPLGPVVRLALGWGTSLAVVLAVAVWIWPRPSVRKAQQSVSMGQAETAAVVSKIRKTELQRPIPARTIQKRRPSSRPESPPPRQPRYPTDDITQAEDLSDPETRIQYIMPVLVPADPENSGSRQQYIMPAVYSTAREPF